MVSQRIQWFPKGYNGFPKGTMVSQRIALMLIIGAGTILMLVSKKKIKKNIVFSIVSNIEII